MRIHTHPHRHTLKGVHTYTNLLVATHVATYGHSRNTVHVTHTHTHIFACTHTDPRTCVPRDSNGLAWPYMQVAGY